MGVAKKWFLSIRTSSLTPHCIADNKGSQDPDEHFRVFVPAILNGYKLVITRMISIGTEQCLIFIIKGVQY
jgi:hypothetical protein